MAKDDVFDAFVSYRHSDANVVKGLVERLGRCGFRIWFDESAIPDFGGISDAAREGLASSKALIVYYSADYPLSAPCQWELTYGFLAAQRLGDPHERVLVVNPESGPDHIEPVGLRDGLYQSLLESDATSVDQVAEAIGRHLEKLKGVLGAGVVQRSVWLPSEPSRSTRFVDREREMWMIHSALHAGETVMQKGNYGPGVAHVRGLGGVGKSLLAREYALRFSAGYPGGVFWLYAQGDLADQSTETEREALRLGQINSFATSVLGPERAAGLASLSPSDVETIFRNVLAQSDTCLWVVDDMPTGLSATEIRRWFGPMSACTLITTRSGEYGALMPEINLGVLPPEEALEILRLRREPSNEREIQAARAIVSELGGHPLAIDVAGATLRLQSYRELLDHLLDPSEDELELAANLREELPTGRERSISTTLSHSIDRLDDGGRDLLRMASMLARDPIPRSLLTEMLARADGLSPAAARTAILRALDEAISLSLIEPVELDSWRLHPLLARTVGLKDEQFSRRDALKSSAVSVLKENFRDVSDPGSRNAIRERVSHARRLVQTVNNVDEAELLGRIARYDYEVGDYSAAKIGHERELAWLMDHIGPGDPGTLHSMSRLAVTLGDMGNLKEARDLAERACEGTAEILGPGDPDTLLAMDELARILFDLGDLEAARQLSEHVLAGYQETRGKEDPATLRAMGTQAKVLWSLGDIERARSLGEDALTGLRRVLGSKHSETLRIMTNLAITINASGDVQAGRKLEEEVLEGRRATLGPRHPETLLAMNNLADTLRAMGEFESAQELAQEAVDVGLEVLGLGHSCTICSMDTLSCVIKERGQFDVACELGSSAMEASRETLGPFHYLTLRIADNLIDTLRVAGKLEQARTLGDETVIACKRVFGPNHPLTEAADDALGKTLSDLEDRLPE